MWPQIKQVGVTYVTHRRFPLLVVFGVVWLAFFLLLGFVLTHKPAIGVQPFCTILFLPMLMLPMFFVGHVKTQFAHPRATLIPHFLPAHLVVVIGILLTVLILYPLLIAACIGSNVVDLIALSVAIAAPAVWGSHFSNMLVMLVGLVSFYSPLTIAGANWWLDEGADHRWTHVAILAVGAGLLAAWVVRLATMREESDDYQNTVQFCAARPGRAEGSEQRRVVAAQLNRHRLSSWVGDQWHARVGGYHGSSFPRIVRLLRYGLNSTPGEYQAVSMTLIWTASAIFFGEFSYIREEASPGILTFFFNFAVLLPAVAAGEALAKRRARTATELLYPLSRGQFVDGLLTASAWNSGVYWLCMNLSLLVVMRYLLPDQVTPMFCMMLLVISIATFGAASGVAMRIAVWPSTLKRLTVLITMYSLLIVPLILWWNLHAKYGQWPFVWVAVLFAAAAVALIQSARTAWRNLELA